MLRSLKRTPPSAPQAPALSLAPGLSQRAIAASGQPISYLMHKALAHPELISLAAGFVDQASLPVETADEAWDIVFGDPRRARAALQYGTTPGHPPLREAVLAQLVADDLAAKAPTDAIRGISVDQVVVTAGSNQMLHLLADTLLDPGDIVLCAAPTYFVFLGILQNLGARSIGVATDAGGIIPEALDEALRHIDRAGELARVKAIYLVSYFDNPTSITTAGARREPIVQLAKRWSRRGRIRILEDAAYRALRYDGPDEPSLRAFDSEGDTVIHTQTFSKSFSPGVRVGWGILPRDLVEPVCDQKGNIDFGSANLNQQLMAAVMEKGLLEPHIDMLRETYRAKQAAMLAAADEFLAPLAGVRWMRPKGGLYVWLELPENDPTGPTGRLFDAAVHEGVLYVPGEYFYPSEGVPASHSTIRLSFGVQSPERIRAGIEGLSRAIRSVLG